MSNYIEYNDKIAFHPGYYIKEIIEESGLSQKDFAKRLDTTPKNLSILVRGEQSLSIDIAMKLSRMLGTSVDYWLNLQKSYDALIAEFESSKELEQERRIFKYFQYTYFRENFGLPDLPRKTNEQIKCLREFLNVASLSVFTKQNMAVSFRSASEDMKEANTARANAMVQIAINQALKIEAPKFDKKKFEKAVDYALTLTTQHGDFYPLIRKAFEDAGVIFVILPNLPASKAAFSFTAFFPYFFLTLFVNRGFPQKVPPMVPAGAASMISALAVIAEIGSPAPRDFAVVIISAGTGQWIR